MTERPKKWHYLIVPKVLLWLCVAVAALVLWTLGATPLICEGSWHEWPVKRWPGCFQYELSISFPNWIESLATGNAAIGSYLIAAIIAGVLFIYLPFVGLTIVAGWLGELNERRRADGSDEQQASEFAEDEDTGWTQRMVDEMIEEALADKPTMLEFPGFSPLWSFGTQYRGPESKFESGPAGWYGVAYEFGGSYLADGWYEIAAEFGEKVHPCADTASPNECLGWHSVGPHPDPTSALLTIMKYVQRLESEKERERSA